MWRDFRYSRNPLAIGIMAAESNECVQCLLNSGISVTNQSNLTRCCTRLNEDLTNYERVLYNNNQTAYQLKSLIPDTVLYEVHYFNYCQSKYICTGFSRKQGLYGFTAIWLINMDIKILNAVFIICNEYRLFQFIQDLNLII